MATNSENLTSKFERNENPANIRAIEIKQIANAIASDAIMKDAFSGFNPIRDAANIITNIENNTPLNSLDRLLAIIVQDAIEKIEKINLHNKHNPITIANIISTHVSNNTTIKAKFIKGVDEQAASDLLFKSDIMVEAITLIARLRKNKPANTCTIH
ncbi:MAG: hypothetical protein KAJ86_06470 [Alphaproteobacteria bacterium]|nr:hypothetical protein [Alphaproteobacteria bacterium]